MKLVLLNVQEYSVSMATVSCNDFIRLF